jgi:hypothetical protein
MTETILYLWQPNTEAEAHRWTETLSTCELLCGDVSAHDWAICRLPTHLGVAVLSLELQCGGIGRYEGHGSIVQHDESMMVMSYKK